MLAALDLFVPFELKDVEDERVHSDNFSARDMLCSPSPYSQLPTHTQPIYKPYVFLN